ncbi:MAG: hypothetical protein V1664_05105 [Candidatus Uhrbacteria bacterium]
MRIIAIVLASLLVSLTSNSALAAVPCAAVPCTPTTKSEREAAAKALRDQRAAAAKALVDQCGALATDKAVVARASRAIESASQHRLSLADVAWADPMTCIMPVVTPQAGQWTWDGYGWTNPITTANAIAVAGKRLAAVEERLNATDEMLVGVAIDVGNLTKSQKRQDTSIDGLMKTTFGLSVDHETGRYTQIMDPNNTVVGRLANNDEVLYGNYKIEGDYPTLVDDSGSYRIPAATSVMGRLDTVQDDIAKLSIQPNRFSLLGGGLGQTELKECGRMTRGSSAFGGGFDLTVGGHYDRLVLGGNFIGVALSESLERPTEGGEPASDRVLGYRVLVDAAAGYAGDKIVAGGGFGILTGATEGLKTVGFAVTGYGGYVVSEPFVAGLRVIFAPSSIDDGQTKTSRAVGIFGTAGVTF